MLQQTKAEAPAAEQGSVTLVGAGPGDPELLTLRAVRALQSADVILYDDLVSKEVLDFARREAKRMLVGKTGHGPSCKQSEINALMVGLAKSGRRVVRLKGGDPMIFGRAGEEIEACRKAGIAIEMVPGITAAQGAASRLGISLTHRSAARRVQYLTGHGENGALPEDIDWRSVADPARHHASIYMPKKTLAAICRSRARRGPRSGDTRACDRECDAAGRKHGCGTDQRTCESGAAGWPDDRDDRQRVAQQPQTPFSPQADIQAGSPLRGNERISQMTLATKPSRNGARCARRDRYRRWCRARPCGPSR